VTHLTYLCISPNKITANDILKDPSSRAKYNDRLLHEGKIEQSYKSPGSSPTCRKSPRKEKKKPERFREK
jgi:hypothetical protein